MIDKPGLTNRYYSLFLILMGLLGFTLRYITNSDIQLTALIPAVVGIILFPMSKPMDNDNHVIGHIAVTITLVFGLVSLYMLISTFMAAGAVNLRKAYLFGVMFLVSGIVTWLYVLRFIRVKKRKNAETAA